MRLLRLPRTTVGIDDKLDATTTAARRRVLTLSCTAHALHDGYTDMIYALLPIWQSDFGLNYGALAVLRGIYAGTMATLQLPAGRLARRIGNGATLALGTLLAALGYAFAGLSGGLVALGAALALSGIGSSTQHPVASGAVSRIYGANARGPLSIYNFAGDLGKSALPASISLLVTVMPWRHALWIVSALGVAVALFIGRCFPAIPREAVLGTSPDASMPLSPTPISSPTASATTAQVKARRAHSALNPGFMMLFLIGVFDTGVRMGLLTFLPFLLKEKGAAGSLIGTALALVFIGGAAGKFACGWLGARTGVIGTVLATESGTAICIIAVMFCSLPLTLMLLPLLGVMLNGTSSVLYGTVPELTSTDHTERAFAIFYTGTIGSGAIAPIIYGILGDHLGVHGATFATALTAIAILPLALGLRRYLP
ncbi:MFS family permease [Robbsia andropogonis]|uniref:MFS transporter n=1 Tax=Robbsia andropogonis TaxID=28092 RepID=UPI003D1B8373